MHFIHRHKNPQCYSASFFDQKKRQMSKHYIYAATKKLHARCVPILTIIIMLKHEQELTILTSIHGQHFHISRTSLGLPINVVTPRPMGQLSLGHGVRIISPSQ